MLLRHRQPHDLTENDATPEGLYHDRRTVLGAMLAAGLLPQAIEAQAYEVKSDLARLPPSAPARSTRNGPASIA
jgi:hypothetical protein